MKKLIKFIIGSVATVSFLFTVLFSIYCQIFTPDFILNKIGKCDYYTKAIDEIRLNIDYKIVNENIKITIFEVINEEKVKDDIDRMVNSIFNKDNIYVIINKETKNKLSENIKESLSNVDYDESSFNELVNTTTESYMKDIFPYVEFKQIERLILPNNIKNMILIGSYCVTGILILILILLDLHKHKSSLYRSLMTIGSLLLVSFIFINLEGLFKNFYYSNEYFSVMIKSIFYYFVNSMGIIGIAILILVIVLEIINVIFKRKTNDKNY